MKYLLGFLASIALIALVFVLLLRAFTHSGEPKQKIDLLDYATSQTVVRLTVDGPVTADAKHQGFRITVGRDTAVMEVTKGYQGSITEAKTYANNTDAYAVFLRSLQLMGYTKGSSDTKQTDERGVCPNGTRYIYEIVSAETTVQRSWNTSCGGGSFKGDKSLRSLFFRQIPDFNVLSRGIDAR